MEWKHHKLNGIPTVIGPGILSIPITFDLVEYSYDFIIDQENWGIGPGYNFPDQVWEQLVALYSKGAKTHSETQIRKSQLKTLLVKDWEIIRNTFSDVV
jgi:hypothetical protein